MTKDVWKRFGDKWVLRNINIGIEDQEFYGLLGPNGAGKTTLLRIIVGVLKPTRGRVIINGIDMTEDPIRAKKLIGYVPQENILDPFLTGIENLLYYAGLQGLSRSEARKRARELLEFFGLEEYVNVRVAKYSGGMKKKLSIAAGLIHDPPILILDEPTVGLDVGARRNLWGLLQKLRSTGKTIIMATHYMEEADILCDRVAIINEGEIIVEAPPSELKRKYGSLSVIEVEAYIMPKEFVEATRKLALAPVIVRNNKIRIPVEDYKTILPRIVEEALRYRIGVKRIEVSEPTLEDVFIKLTGRGLT